MKRKKMNKNAQGLSIMKSQHIFILCVYKGFIYSIHTTNIYCNFSPPVALERVNAVCGLCLSIGKFRNSKNIIQITSWDVISVDSVNSGLGSLEFL